MCDQTEVSYSDGDVVWVKIGPIWWPGVVKDVSKEEEVFDGLKYKPIATVQFFDEEKYEFVKSLDQIYKYNCSRKDEFLKKGLDKYRGGAKHMVKFPEDITKAEELVKGDINIVNDPKFAAPEKKNYNDLFGTPKKPKARKTEDFTLRSKLPLKKRLSAPGHRLVSSHSTPRSSKTAELACPLCDFSANLIPTMSSHFLYFHSSQQSNYGNSSAPKRARPTPSTHKRKGRPAKPKTDTPTSIEPSLKSTPATKAVNSINPEKKKRFTDALLADWSEEEDNKDKEGENSATDLNENINVSESAELELKELNMPTDDDANKDVGANVHNNYSGSVEGFNDNDRRETSSCFDFDDEDDGFIGMSDAYTYGRKIPRVIPVKDKTDLGRDLEVDEVFKKKPDSEDMEDDEETKETNLDKPIKKKRGRPTTKNPLPKDTKSISKAHKEDMIVKRVTKSVPISLDGLAATRQRRPGARKSYLNLVIESVDDVVEPVTLEELKPLIHKPEKIQIDEREPEEESEPEETPKPSRRKQDLKRQKLLEYDDAMLADKMRKMQESEPKKKIFIIEKEDLKVKNSLAVLSDEPDGLDGQVVKNIGSNDSDLTAQVESLLAETKAPTALSKTSSFSPTRIITPKHEQNLGEIEYLEDDPPPIVSPVKKFIPSSPIKKIKTIELEQAVNKSVIPQWKQGIQESLKLNKELHAAKEGITKLETPKANIIKLSTHRVVQPQQKSPRYLILSPQQGLGINSANSTHRFKLANLPRTSNSSIVQLDPTRKKVIKLSSAVQQKQMKGEGIQMIKNLIGPGKTAVILKDISGSSIGRKIMVNPDKRLYVQRKGPDGNITLKSIVPPKRSQQIVFNNQTVKFVPKTEEIVEAPVVESVLEHVAASETVTNLANSQQVILPPTGDVQTTYMLVTVDGQTVLQAVDSSLLPFNVQPGPGASTQLYQTPNNEMKQVYSLPGQDILAEALANTNVLESEMPLMMPSVVQETCITMQKPIMTPLELPSTILPDPALIIAPSVQETSVTLQNPIMTPVEVPTSVVADTTGLHPPPLPPTPTAEDVMMDDPEDNLMIAEQPQQLPISDDTQNQNFFIDDSQEAGEEVNSFQSMPLLNEESTASEEHIGDQNFDVQGTNLENTEYLPSSTNPDLETTEQEIPLLSYNTEETQEEVVTEGKRQDVESLPFLSEEGLVETGEVSSSQETEVTSTTCDSKENVV